MDAAQTNSRKIVFYLVAALLLAAPIHGYAQAFLTPSSTTVSLGSSSCNDFQNVSLSSSVSGAAIAFTVAVNYPYAATDQTSGNWVYAGVNGGTTTSAPISGTTGASGATLSIGLARSLFVATDTAQVTLTPSGSGVDPTPITITVYYQQNAGCGGGTGSVSNGPITITPGSLSLTAGQGGQQSQALTIQNNTGQTLTFAVNATGGPWLTVAATSTTISANGQTPVTVTANSAQVSALGTYNGNVTITPQAGFGSALTIPVTFAVTSATGAGGGGSLTLNGSTNSTYYASFTYTPPGTPSGQCIGIQDSAPGANSYSYQVSTVSGGSWLLANYFTNGTTTGLLTASSNACVTIALTNLSGLANGVYQGSVALTSSSGSTATINVTLYVTGGAAPGVNVTPGVVYTFPGVPLGSTALQSQTFSISAATGYFLGTAAPTGNGGSWFSMSTPVTNGNTQSFTVLANPSSLVAGVYFTTITVTSTGSVQGTTTILVVLPVGQPGSTSGSLPVTAAPTALTFQQQTGSSFWSTGQEAQAIAITGPQGSQWTASVIYGNGGSNWLTFDSPSTGAGTFGSGPSSLVVDLASGVQSLTASATPYTATITIGSPSGNATISVSLLVTAANVPVLLGKPGLSTFSSSGGSAPAAQTVTVVGSDNTSSTTSPFITVGTPSVTWVTATSSGNAMTLTVNPAGQAAGLYSGTVPVSATAYTDPINYPVVLVVNGGGASTGPLTLNPASIAFANVTGPQSSSLNVTASNSTSFTVTALQGNCTSTNWLVISPGGSQTASSVNFPIAVNANPTGIANGTTCNGTITLVTSTATQVVNVTMTVGASTGGNVTVSPTQLSFSYTQNQGAPAAQTVTIVNSTSGTAAIPFTVTTAVQGGGANWLQTSAASAQTPYNNPGLVVSVAPGALGSGTYQGTVTITPTGGTPVAINVSFTVAGAAQVTASTTSISLSYQAGGVIPTSAILVSAGGAVANFTATAVSTPAWLQVSPTSGTTPSTGGANLTVSLSPTVLATLQPSGSPYTGTITISGTSPATGTTVVTVTLNVTALLPTITGITNGASYSVGAVSPGEIISIFANAATGAIGPSTVVQLNSTTCPSPCTQIPTSMGGVQVTFYPTGKQAPLIFVSAGQINAVVPYEAAGIANQSVEVKYLNQTSNAFPIAVAATAPGIFTANSSGTGQAAVLQYDQNGTPQGVNSAGNPAKKGWYLAIYMTGEGVLNPAASDGAVTSVVETPYVVPSVLIGNQPATVAGYAEAPGLVSGVLQVNALVPQTAGTGSVPLQVSLGTASSQVGVTVALQ